MFLGKLFSLENREQDIFFLGCMVSNCWGSTSLCLLFP